MKINLIISALSFFAVSIIPGCKDKGHSINIVEQIKKVAKLQTVEMTTSTILERSKSDWAKATTHVSYFVSGTVTANIDLEKTEISCDEEKNLVTIRLPEKPEVSNATHGYFRELCEFSTFFTAPKFTSAQKSIHVNAAYDSLKQIALRSGIEKLALDHAKEYLTIFINALGRDVKFLPPLKAQLLSSETNRMITH